MLHLFFYGLPLLGAFVYGLLKPGCTWMSDWSVFFAGAVIQVKLRRQARETGPEYIVWDTGVAYWSRQHWLFVVLPLVITIITAWWLIKVPTSGLAKLEVILIKLLTGSYNQLIITWSRFLLWSIFSTRNKLLVLIRTMWKHLIKAFC